MANSRVLSVLYILIAKSTPRVNGQFLLGASRGGGERWKSCNSTALLSHLKEDVLDPDRLSMHSEEDLIEYWSALGPKYSAEEEYIALANRLEPKGPVVGSTLMTIARFLVPAGYYSSRGAEHQA